MSRFVYPRLPREDIIEVIASYGIANVTETHLSNPNRDSISKLYTQILINLGVLRGEEEEENGLIEFSNPDLDVDSVRLLTLFHKIRDLISVLECPEKFSLYDLITPDPQRTEYFLGALCNFFVHRDAGMNALQPYMDELFVVVDQQKAFQGRISELTLELLESKESREREMPLIQEVDTKNKEMHVSISTLNKHQVSLRESIKKRKEALREMDEKISSAKFDLVQSAQENASLHSKIVQSPVKLQRALEEKKAVLVEADNAERVSMQSYHEQSAILEVLTKASRKMTKHLKQMQTLQEQANSAKQVEKDVKVLKVKNSDDGVLDKSLQAKLSELQGRADQLEELLKLMEKERDASCEKASKKLNNVKSLVESDRHGLEQRRRNVEALVEERAAINENVNKVKDSAAAKQQMLLRKAEELTKAFFNYTNSTGQLVSQIEALDAEET